MKFTFLCAFAILFFSSSCKSNKKMEGDTIIPFETILRTAFSGSETKGTMVVQKKNDLENFEVANENEMPEELLEVDYEKNTLIMVMAGTKNTGGFDIEIEKIIETNNGVTVFYKETNPPKDAMLIMAFTYPTHAVTIKKTDKEIIFNEITTKTENYKK